MNGTIGIWKISSRLVHVISYTTDEEKTSTEEFIDLHQALDYVEADFKTEEQLYVSAINCGVSTAFEEMKITKEQWSKKDGIQGFHCFQSFYGREVDASTAHEIGIKLANEIWGERFEVIVSTHLNTENIHNHFVINSVSFKDGKKYQDKRETYALLRHTNDVICEEYGLSVLKEKVCRKSGIDYSAYLQKNVQHNNYYSDTKADIDMAIKQANTYKDFENILRAMKYQLTYRGGKLSVRKAPYKKNIRIHRMFGEEYVFERIEERIQNEFVEVKPYLEVTSSYKYYTKHHDYKRQKAKGLYGLYLHYCYLLKVFPTKYPKRVLDASIRADLKNVLEISKQAIYLNEH